MNEKTKHHEEGQSMVVVAASIIILLIFVVITVDLAYAYVHRRTDQNAADAAALAGTDTLAQILNAHDNSLVGKFVPESPIQAAMNEFAERNGIEDTDGSPGNALNTNIEGYYLGEDGVRIGADMEGNGGIQIGQVGWVHPDARGVEAITHSLAPTFFGGILGLDGLPLQAEAAVVLEEGACTAGCLAPIATLTETFEFYEDTGACYNIWDGPKTTKDGGGSGVCSIDSTTSCDVDADCDFSYCKLNGTCADNPGVSCSIDADCVGTCEAGDDTGDRGSGNYGWLNWSNQGNSCSDIGEPDDCSVGCLEYNLNHDNLCHSGLISVGSWVAGATGIKNAVNVRDELDWYIDAQEPLVIIIYDVIQGTGCGKDGRGTHYHVVGFAAFQVTGYRLSRGAGNAVMRDTLNPDSCSNWGGSGNRITGIFRGWITEGFGGNCPNLGLSVPRVIK
jgi:hypothetical protein